MSGMWSGRAMIVLGLVLAGASLPAWGQTQATFTGVGVLGSDAASNTYGVSPDGDYVTGESLDGSGNPQAFIYTTGTAPATKRGISHPTDWTTSSGQGIDVDSDGYIHVAGTGKNASGNDQAFYYDDNSAGPDKFTPIPFLSGGSVSKGQAIRWHVAPNADVVVVGVSSRSAGYDHGFMWKRSTGSLTDLWNTPSSSAPGQSGTDSPCDGASCLAFRSTRMVVYGTGETHYGCGNFSPGAFLYDEGGQYWYNYLEYWAQFDQCPPVTVSTAYGTAPSGRNGWPGGGDWLVGSSTFKGVDEHGWNTETLLESCNGSNRMAYLLYTDEHFEQDTPLQQCVDFSEERRPDIKSRMLGFLPGHEGFSEGWGVSGDGLIVVGRAYRMVTSGGCYDDEVNFVAFIWDATHGMRNLQTVLTGAPYNLDLTGWELTEARAMSEDGTVICGLGLHTVSPGNTRWEGWVATIERPGVVGACCRHADMYCSESTQWDCQSPGTTFTADVTCDDIVCCHTPFADSDGDGDVDQVDFGAWQLCYTGSGGGILPDCDCWDRDKTTPLDVDGDDFTAFNNCWTGPNVPYSVALPSGCNP